MPRAKKAKPEQSIDQVADDAIASILKDHAAPAVTQPVKPEGVFVDASPITEAETAVSDLIDAQASADGAEHRAIVRMFELLAVGVASPKEFATRYAAVVAERGLKLSSLAARKSNLKKVLEFAIESVEFKTEIIASGKDENSEDLKAGGMGLQAMYTLRAEKLKLANPKADKVSEPVQAEEPTDDDTSSMSNHDVVLHQINNAIDAAANAGYDDIAAQLRGVFYQAKNKELRTRSDNMLYLRESFTVQN